MPVLSFAPLFKELVWGGRRLETLLGKKLPEASTVGESWEIVDLAREQSIVEGGPLCGATLASLVSSRGPELLGEAPAMQGRFPFLLKFIDANDVLSVQVHPDEAACARLGGEYRPKTEAWYIVDRAPGAFLYAGLRPQTDKASFEAALASGSVDRVLHRLAVEPGDFVFLPAGTVHAIGPGIVLAEVQQTSETTFRVFDWNRVGLDGAPRPLHLSEALESIDFGGAGRAIEVSRHGVSCRFFTVKLATFGGQGRAELSSRGPLAFMGAGGDGSVRLRAGEFEEALVSGQTVLVPACLCERVVLERTGHVRVLCVRVG